MTCGDVVGDIGTLAMCYDLSCLLGDVVSVSEQSLRYMVCGI